ncbi:MAG: Gfo/Idh/MocA family oxidoreductase [Verrucomicrobiales bacterium]|nr:Gfo/Idh/MocA family oxidoreductase [Verrucomicrobiales bacterium]
MKSNRRIFLKSSLASAAGMAVPMSTWCRAAGANGDLRIAVIGCNDPGKNPPGGRGRYHMKEIVGKMKHGGVRVAAICDVDSTNLDGARAELEKSQIKAEYYQDFRKLLESKEVDGVIIATPNHTHSLIAAWALESGKHVYVEKPVSHNIWEGRQLSELARKHSGKLVCQHGMQRRNDPVWEKVIEFVKSGKIGKPLLSRGLCYKTRPSIGQVGTPQPPPSTVEYDLWSGPRKPEPVPRKRLHYDWHWQWPWGNGDIGNQGPHQLDVARWLIGDPQELPASVISIGGRFGYEDDATTANTQIAYFDFKPVPIIFEVRGLPDANLNFKGPMPVWRKTGVRVGNILHCEGGYIAEGIVYENGSDKVIDKSMRPNDGVGHQDKFFESMRSGKIAPTHQVLTGHLSAALAHMANISYRLGREMGGAQAAETIKGNAEFSETCQRFLEHLQKNGIKTDEAKIVTGPMLAMDGRAEKFTGELADAANNLATEDYREPFVMPKV